MKQITLPEGISPELAEEVGIHIGDGSLVLRPKYHQYEYYVTLSKEEKEYMKYVCELIHSLYSIEGKPKESSRDGSLRVRFSSKTLAMWKISLGLPIGRKDTVLIPPTILESKYILDCV